MWKNILVIFFAINALFCSLFTHETHCKLAHTIMDTCPSHNIHLTIGILSFIIAFVLAQYNYLKTLF
jgi:hypothetical protein